MIHIYHGARAYWPLMAGMHHLERIGDNSCSCLPSNWKWEKYPLYPVGRDCKGDLICCLVHGRYGGLYCRAINGVAAIFKIHVCCINVDSLLFTSSSQNIASYITAILAKYLPKQFGRRYRQMIAKIVEQQLQ